MSEHHDLDRAAAEVLAAADDERRTELEESWESLACSEEEEAEGWAWWLEQQYRAMSWWFDGQVVEEVLAAVAASDERVAAEALPPHRPSPEYVNYGTYPSCHCEDCYQFSRDGRWSLAEMEHAYVEAGCPRGDYPVMDPAAVARADADQRGEDAAEYLDGASMPIIILARSEWRDDHWIVCDEDGYYGDDDEVALDAELRGEDSFSADQLASAE